MKKLILLLLVLTGCGQDPSKTTPPVDPPEHPEIDRCISYCDIKLRGHRFNYKKIVKCYRKCIGVEE